MILKAGRFQCKVILKFGLCHPGWWMRIRMENVGSLAPERITDFLSGSAGIEFTGQSRTDKYAYIEGVLVEQQYSALTKKQRGAVRALLTKVSGLSMPQLTGLIRRYREDGQISLRTGARQHFPTKYSSEDLELLIEVDRAHQRLSGPATRRILQREWHVFGQQKFARLAEISVAHLPDAHHYLRDGTRWELMDRLA